MSAPTQAPVMSREEWEKRITRFSELRESCNKCGGVLNGASRDFYVKATREGNGIIKDIMSLQSELTGAREEVARLTDEKRMMVESLRKINDFDEDDEGDPGSEARRCLKEIEKARQPK